MNTIARFLLIPAILVNLLFIMAGAPPAQADTPSDAELTMVDVQGYRNLADSGDMLILGHLRWTSENTTDAPASSAVTIRLVSANGTLLAATTPYVFTLFEDNGWGEIVYSFYLSENTTWGGASEIQVAGLPAYFEDPPTLDYTLGAADYTAATSQEDNRAEMATYILNQCDALRVIYPDVDLKSNTGSGTVLSSYGEAYYTSVIDNLQTLCPELFFVQTYIPEEIELQDYDMSTADTYKERLAGTDMMISADLIGSYIGVTGRVIIGILTFIGCVYVIYYCVQKRDWALEAALGIDVLILTGVAVLIGDFVFTLVMIIGLVGIAAISFVILGKRA
jgi:hypothetical protein